MLLVGGFTNAQTTSTEQIIFLTPHWQGERFDDGRPKVIGSGPEYNLYAIEGSFDSLPAILIMHEHLLLNAYTFLNYVQKTNVTHILFPNFEPHFNFVYYTREIQSHFGCEEFVGETFTVVDVTNIPNTISPLSIKHFQSKEFNITEYIDPTRFIINKQIKSIKKDKWLPIFMEITDKYYFPERVFGLRSGHKITLEYQVYEGIIYIFNSKISTHYNLRHRKGQSDFIIRIKGVGEPITVYQQTLSNTELKTINLPLDSSNADVISIEFLFDDKGWSRPMQSVIISPRLRPEKSE